MRIGLSSFHRRRLSLVGRSGPLHPTVPHPIGLLSLVDAVGQPGLVAFAPAGDPLQVIEVDLLADAHGECRCRGNSDRLEQRPRIGSLGAAIPPVAGQVVELVLELRPILSLGFELGGQVGHAVIECLDKILKIVDLIRELGE